MRRSSAPRDGGDPARFFDKVELSTQTSKGTVAVQQVRNRTMGGEAAKSLRDLCGDRTGDRWAALRQGLAVLLSAALIVQPGCAPTEVTISVPVAAPPSAAQLPPQAAAGAPSTQFNPEQLDALLASIALYPDDLLMQVLMASTYPLQIVEASRWLAADSNKDLKGNALAQVLQPLPWDPSVKSLVPFPQVLEQMDHHLEWTQQIGYAVATQQGDVLDSIQRLRRQAQGAGTLKSTEQQVVSSLDQMDDAGQPLPGQIITIQPANPQIVYVPTYDPSVIYGTWPYPSYPPIYYPPPGYYLGTGLAFLAGVAIIGSLWGWTGAGWGYGCCGGGSINVNRDRYNNISINNPNRGNFDGSRWRTGNDAGTGRPGRPPGGPVGGPGRIQSLPANAIGRGNVQLPAGAVNRPDIGAGGGGERFGAGAAQRPALQSSQGFGGGGAFSGMRDGSRAGQFQQRGSQSLGMQRSGGFRGGGSRGGRGGGGRGRR
jgi:Protein of unknown function (DUF3300)